MKKVLILSGSPRKGGNSDTLCNQFMRGAQEAGNRVEKIFISEKNIGYCRACYFCASHSGHAALKTIWQRYCKRCLTRMSLYSLRPFISIR